jgi:flagellar protein FlaI
MENNHNEEITTFLQKTGAPTEEDINQFINELKNSDPDIDEEQIINSIKKRSERLNKNLEKIKKLNDSFRKYQDLEYPEVEQFKSLIKEADIKLLNIKDASAEIIQAQRLLDRIILKQSTLKRKTTTKETQPSKTITTAQQTPPQQIQLLKETQQTKTETTSLQAQPQTTVQQQTAIQQTITPPQPIPRPPETTQPPPETKKETTPPEEKTEITEKEKQKAEKKSLLHKLKTFFKKESVEEILYDPQIHGPLLNYTPPENYVEIESYWVNEPYAKIAILHDPDTNTYEYHVIEPALTPIEQTLLLEIKDRLRDALLVEEFEDENDKEQILIRKVKQLIKDYAIEITPVQLEKILYYAKRDFINYDKIDPLMHDNMLEDISANGYNTPIYLFHKQYQNIATNISFDEEELNAFVIRLAQRCGKHISIAEPIVDATMPDGSRIQMTLGTEVTAHGGTFTIRKFSDVPVTPVDLIKWNTFSAEAMAYLWLCIENNKSLIFAGGTASGKTTSLNAVSLFIPPEAKIVSIEDTRELKLPHPNWIPSVTRDSFTADERGAVDMYELLRAALRQRPEYLLVGEVRGREALTLFQAMSTGHTTFSTMHADSVANAIHRLENPPISVPRSMIQALNIISIQGQTYYKGKRVRRNLKLVEIIDIDPNTRNIRTNDIFNWDSMNDTFIKIGDSKALAEIKLQRGWSNRELNQELENRVKILNYMVEHDITEFKAVANIFREYYVLPQKVLKRLGME